MSIVDIIKPIQTVINEVSGKLTFKKGVVNRVLFSTVETIAVSFDPKSKEFFLCYNNSVNKFEMEFF